MTDDKPNQRGADLNRADLKGADPGGAASDGTESSIELGLEEVVSGVVSETGISSQHTFQHLNADGHADDPLRALAEAGDYRGLLTKLEPLVEAAPKESLDSAKIWWLRASVKLGTPEQFLLGAVSEVETEAIPRNGALGALVRESLIELHSAGAVLLASELTRVLGASFAARPESAGASSASVSETSAYGSSLKSPAGKSAVGNQAGGNQTEHTLRGGASANNGELTKLGANFGKSNSRIASSGLLVLFLLVAAGLSAVYLARRISFYGEGAGEVAKVGLGVPKDPPSAALVVPELAPVAPPSALDKVLGALEGATVGGGARRPSGDAGGAGISRVTQGTTTQATTRQATASQQINWDQPVETAEVREAIAAGDPVTGPADQDEKNARRLFGDPQPVMQGPVTGGPPAEVFPADNRNGGRNGARGRESDLDRTRTGQRMLDQIVEYRAVVRTIASREPKFTSPRVVVLEEGEHVFVDKVDGPFLRIRLPDGGSAYVLSQDMEEASN